jgi:asparagine synthase (glutamine-hydrolysing)
MCGIAGLLGYPGPTETTRSIVERMGVTIIHRGPDDRGSYADDDIAMGLQRLSVIDLPGGHQPMATEDGAIHIAFNGEIYNYRQVRAELMAAGETFRTASDTEVILRQYRRRGLDGFAALNGMFAVAIWDRRTRELHLVRDRMGVKPLYYYWDGKVFAFASEIKALLEIPGITREINPRAIWDYLTFRYVPAPHTIWKHVSKLPPGHRLTIAAAQSSLSVSRWWTLPAPRNGTPTGEADAAAEFGTLFEDAVKLRMIADVPVGIMLSGGIDSSAVASVAVESHGRDLKTFSVAFKDSPAIDERHFARQVARHLGTDHEEVEIGADEFLDFLPRLVHLTDEPLADLASVPLYYVAALARRRVTVVLSGEGADEVLAGYDFDRWWAARASLPAGGDVRRDAVPPHMTNYMDSDAKRDLFRAPTLYPDSLDVVRAHLARAGDRHPLDQMLFLYCQDWLVEDLLMKADRASMATSLELRTPFLDYRLVEWAATAPVSAKIGPDAAGRLTTKRVLRDFARGRLPVEIIERPKRGFPVPVYDWLATTLKRYAEDMVLGPQSPLAAWFNAQPLRALVARGTAPEAAAHDRHRLWHLVILAQWFDVWQR